MSDAAEELELDEEEETLEESSADLLELSDEDFATLEEPSNDTEAAAQDDDNDDTDEDEVEPADTAEGDTGDVQDVEESTDDEQAEETDTVDDEEESEDDSTEEPTEDESLQAQYERAKKTKEGEDSEEGEEASDAEQPDVDFKAEYEKIVAPFKANGKEIKVNSVDDAITLMKMGANYNKKMAGLKPNLKLMKMLSNNDLLNEEKLSYLIDLQNKNPEAITKFIKESGIDPMDLDTEKDTEYKPSSYTVNDKEIELDLVLEDIQDSPTFDKIIDVISTKWDGSSKEVVLADPQLIKVINGHMEAGIYDQITTIVDSEKMLGRLTELSDLEAYKYVGDLLQEQGAFNQSKAVEEKPKVPVKKKTTARKSEDPKLKEKRKAAGSPQGVPSDANFNFNPLELSDEEFEEAAGKLNII